MTSSLCEQFDRAAAYVDKYPDHFSEGMRATLAVRRRGRGGEGRGGKGRDGKGREGKGREGKGRDGTGREGKGRDGKEGGEVSETGGGE